MPGRVSQETPGPTANDQGVTRALPVAIGACLALTSVTACTTSSVSLSTHVAQVDKATYGPSWPFREDSVVSQCQTATGHPARLSLTVGSASYSVDGPTGQALPDDLFRPGGRQNFPSLYARLLTGC